MCSRRKGTGLSVRHMTVFPVVLEPGQGEAYPVAKEGPCALPRPPEWSGWSVESPPEEQVDEHGAMVAPSTAGVATSRMRHSVVARPSPAGVPDGFPCLAAHLPALPAVDSTTPRPLRWSRQCAGPFFGPDKLTCPGSRTTGKTVICRTDRPVPFLRLHIRGLMDLTVQRACRTGC